MRYINSTTLIKHMKTKPILYRNLNNVQIRQDSKDSYFNANDLLNLYLENGGKDKRIYDFLELNSTKEYMSEILRQENLNNADCRELEVVRTKRGQHGGTWMHPYLFIDFAMWLNVEFKYQVVKWIYDNLIELRLDSGDSFKDVNKALMEHGAKVAHWTYSNEAKMINKLVFGDAQGGQRDSATKEQLDLLGRLQKADIQLISEGLDFYERYEKLKELKKYL